MSTPERAAVQAAIDAAFDILGRCPWPRRSEKRERRQPSPEKLKDWASI